MDEDLIYREILKSLTFEIEAVNKDNVLKWTTTDSTPLNVKVRVRNKDEPRLIQKGAVPVPRIGITAPEKLKQISSNQTILSFKVFLEEDLQKEETKRHDAFKIFNIGGCLGTYNDDEGPYLPSSSIKKALEDGVKSKPGSDTDIHKKVSPDLNPSNAAPHKQKYFLGKCKPGGCLDPPFDEDNYPYGPPKTYDENDCQIEVHTVTDKQNIRTPAGGPAGCLDPPFSEEKYAYVRKTNSEEVKESKLNETKDDELRIGKKSVEESSAEKPLASNTTKNEIVPTKVADIYARISRENSLELKYTNSIITYATDVSSNETLQDQFPNKKISTKSNDDVSKKQNYHYPESYFVPPKDVIRRKDDERRYSQRISDDKMAKTSKGTDQATIENTKSVEYVHITQGENKELELMELKPNNMDDKQYKQVTSDILQISSSVPKFKIVAGYQNGLSKQIESISKTTDSGLRKNEDVEIKPLETIKANVENTNAERDMSSAANTDKNEDDEIKPLETIKANVENTNAERDMSSAANTDNGSITKDKQPEVQSTIQPSEHTKISNDQGPMNGQFIFQDNKKKHDGMSRKPQADSVIPILTTATMAMTDNQTLELKDKRNVGIENDDISRKPQIADSVLPILTTATMAMTDNQTLEFKDKRNVGIENDDISRKPQIADFVIPILTTATMAMTDNQTLEFKDKRNVGIENDDMSRKPQIADSVIATKAVTQNQSLKFKDKPNIDIDMAITETSRVKTKEFINESPKNVSSSENNEFDVSSGHSIDFKNEPSDNLKTNYSVNTISQTQNANVLIANNVSRDYTYVRREHQEKKSSAILHKQPYISTRNDPDIQHDDINKSISFKRNTFTIIKSDISLHKGQADQESEVDIETKEAAATADLQAEEPEKNSNILGTVRNKTKPEISITKESELYTDTLHISPPPHTTPTDVTDIHLNIVDDDNSSHKTPIPGRNDKEKDSSYKPEKILFDNQRQEDPAQKYKWDEEAKSYKLYRNPSKESKEETLTENKYAPSDILSIKQIEETRSINVEEFIETAENRLQNPMTHTAQDLYVIDTVSNKSHQDHKSGYLYTNTGESEPVTDMYSSVYETQKPKLEDTGSFRSNTTTDDKFLLESSANDKIERSEELASKGFDTKPIHKVYDINDKDTFANGTFVTTTEINIFDKSYQQSTDEIITEQNIVASSNTVLVSGGEFDSAVTVKKDEQKELFDDYFKSSVEFSHKITPVSTGFHAERTDGSKYTSPDKINENSMLNNTDSIEPKHLLNLDDNSKMDAYYSNLPEHIEHTPNLSKSYQDTYFESRELVVTQNVRDQFLEFNESTDNVSNNNSPFGGYSGLASEVLSNISENREGEENISMDSKLFTETHKMKDVTFNVARNSFEKSSTSRFIEPDTILHKHIIPKAFESIEVLENSFDKLGQSSNVEVTDKALPGRAPDISESSKIAASSIDLIVFDEIIITDKQVTHQKPITKQKVENLQSSLIKRDQNPLYLDMSFYSYMNSTNQRVVQTHSPPFEQQSSNDGTVTIVKTLIRHGNEIRIPVDKENDISLNILQKDVKIERRNSIIGSTISQYRREKHVVDRVKRQDDVQNKNLALIYESELIPLHNIIKDLTLDVNKLSVKQEMLQLNMRNPKRTKSLRFIPVVKRCGCRRC